MKPFLTVCQQGTRLCLRCVLTLTLWCLWLALLIALGLQITILASRELTVPAWVRRDVEARLETLGLRADLGKITFDPAGRVLVENLSLSTTNLKEPIVTVRALSARLDPWLLLAGHLSVSALDLSGARLRYPALLSPSGENEAVLDDIAATLRFDDDQWTIDSLTARIGRLEGSLRGNIQVPRPRASAQPLRQRVEAGVQAYLRTSRQLLDRFRDLEQFESPRLDAVLTENERGVFDLDLRLQVDRIQKLATWIKALPEDTRASGVRLSTRLQLAPERETPVALQIAVDRVAGDGGLLVREARARLDGRLSADRSRFTPVSLDLAAAETRRGDLALRQVTTHTPLPAPAPEISALWGGHPWSLRIRDLDRAQGRVTLEAAGPVGEAHLALADKLAGRVVSDQLELKDTPSVAVEVQLDRGWKLDQLRGRLAVGAVTARTVPLDGASASFSYRGTSLVIEDIVLRTGESLAQGSYTMDTGSLDFRFLLQGRLQPARIAGWFREWWPRLWSHFDFSASLPTADVDVRGRWGKPELTTVFVAAENGPTGLRGTAFDTARTRLFVRPQFYEIRHFHVTQGERFARGTFNRLVDLEKRNWRSMEFEAFSNLDVAQGARVVGPEIVEIVAPFTFTQPAQLRVSGRLDGPAAPGGPRRAVNLAVYSTGPFTYFEFPLRDLNAAGEVRDDDIILDPISVGFADGVANGRIHLSDLGVNRRLGFDFRLTQAQLGESIRSLEEFGARRRGEPPPKQNRFQEKVAAGRLDLAVSADGRFDDLFSYKGQGNAVLTGAELGEVRLLWVLSQLLERTFFNFSTLKLDTVQANFAVAGSKLVFSEVRITGPRAAIEAQGDYFLDRKSLEMKAKLFPFEESTSLFGAAADLVLSPFSQAFEFKLTGALDKPSWTFVYGPTNFLRTITGSNDKPAEAPPPPR